MANRQMPSPSPKTVTLAFNSPTYIGRPIWLEVDDVLVRVHLPIVGALEGGGAKHNVLRSLGILANTIATVPFRVQKVVPP